MKENNFGKDHHVKFILDQILCSSKVGTFYQMQQSHFEQICISLIFKIPPTHMVVSGHSQLNQTNHFQIWNLIELNQILQEIELGKYGINSTLFEIVF